MQKHKLRLHTLWRDLWSARSRPASYQTRPEALKEKRDKKKRRKREKLKIGNEDYCSCPFVCRRLSFFLWSIRDFVAFLVIVFVFVLICRLSLSFSVVAFVPEVRQRSCRQWWSPCHLQWSNPHWREIFWQEQKKWAMLKRVNSLVNLFSYLGEMAFMQGMAAAG